MTTAFERATAPLLKQCWLRIFADGEWHTVVGYHDTECRPADTDHEEDAV